MALKFSLRQHKHPITCLLLTNTLYSADNSGTIIQWRLEDRRPLKQIQTQPVVNMMEHQDNLFVQLRNGWILIYQDLEVVGKIQCAELTFCRFKIREDRMLYCRKDPSVVDLMDMRSNDLLMTKGTEDGVCMSMFLGDKVCVGYEDGSLLVDDELLFLFKHPVLSVDQRDKTIAATSAGGELLISSDQVHQLIVAESGQVPIWSLLLQDSSRT
ncbi:hypothetical protein EDD86DRAFT_61136 [Gorgonomyces haynaldii]|nr:hypothetical protein EDD86DRAFT_61136 [Gorgonomyces haynaldii]